MKYFSYVLLSSIAMLIIFSASGCTYHEHYHTADDTLPPGDYELKESVPVHKERVVERHYVVE